MAPGGVGLDDKPSRRAASAKENRERVTLLEIAIGH
jgi:hypothetical protein